MGKIKDDLDWLSSSHTADLVSGGEDYLAYLADPARKIGIYYVVEAGAGKVTESLTRMTIGIAQLHCIRANSGALPLFYLEEAATCGKAEFIKKAVSEHRKHFQTILVYQSIGQITHLFGKAGAQEILDSCGLQLFLGGGVRSIDSAKPLAEAIGKRTIFVNRHMAQANHASQASAARWNALWSGDDIFNAEERAAYEAMQSRQPELSGRFAADPAELMRLDNHIIVLSPGMGLRPLLANKLPQYWTNPAMIGRYGPDPLFCKDCHIPISAKWYQSKTRKFIREPAPDHLADWPNHSDITIAYVKGCRTW